MLESTKVERECLTRLISALIDRRRVEEVVEVGFGSASSSAKKEGGLRLLDGEGENAHSTGFAVSEWGWVACP